MEQIINAVLSRVLTFDGEGTLVGYRTVDGEITKAIVRFDGDLFPGDAAGKVITAVEYDLDQVWTVDHDG